MFHLAALIAIPYSYVAPASFVDTNVGGTLHVLEAAGRAGVRRLIHTSTSEVYGTPETLPIRETHPLNAQSPYAATKVAADQLAIAFHRELRPARRGPAPVQHLRPRQSERRVVPTMLRQPGRAAGDPARAADTRRDLTFVADTVDGFVRAAEAVDIDGRTIQLGTGRTESIGEVFELARRLTGSDATPSSTRRGCGRTPARCSRSSPTRRSPASCWAGRRPDARGGPGGDDRVAAEPARPVTDATRVQL